MRRFLSIAQNTKKVNRRGGFTIVELVVVVTVIGILTAIVTISYDAVMTESRERSMRADLQATYNKLSSYKSKNNEYPVSLGTNAITSDTGTTLTYSQKLNGADFCLTAARADTSKTFSVIGDDNILEGACPVVPAYIQAVTSSNCPTTRTMVVGARDNHTYWIQKLADGRCWMLTNLAYVGGGASTYGDTKTLRSGAEYVDMAYTVPQYYIQANANASTYPAQPSTSTDGGATNPQYGCLYNWCAAMGAQTATSACASTTTPSPDVSVSVCPAGWRLPTGILLSGEFALLNASISGSNSSDAGLISSPWLAQRSGGWNGGSVFSAGTNGYLWSSTQYSSTVAYVFSFSSVAVGSGVSYTKNYNFAVRRVAK